MSKIDIPVPESTEQFRGIAIGFGKTHPDLAVLRIVSSTDSVAHEYWFAMSRIQLAEIGLQCCHQAGVIDLNKIGFEA